MREHGPMKWILSAVLLLLAAAAPGRADAQFALEVRGGAAIGNHSPAASGLETIPGPSFSAAVLATPLDWVSLYGVLLRSKFGCEEGFCADRDVQLTTTGLGGGLRLHAGAIPWLQAGVLRMRTDLDTADGDQTGEAGLAYEIGAGLSVPLFGVARLVPGVFYRSSLDEAGRTTVLSAEVGVQLQARR